MGPGNCPAGWATVRIHGWRAGRRAGALAALSMHRQAERACRVCPYSFCIRGVTPRKNIGPLRHASRGPELRDLDGHHAGEPAARPIKSGEIAAQ